MFFNIISIPLFSIVFLLCFNRLLGNKGTAIFSTTLFFFTSVFVYFCVLDTGLNDCFLDLELGNWFYLLGLDLKWSFCFDSLNLIILSMISFVSFLIHLYSLEYMSADPHQSRFMLYLTSFTTSMIVLVSSSNLFQVFFGWELIGLFSYLLINFWFTWLEANKSSIKAMLINRIGDFFLTISFFLIFFCFKSIEFSTISSLSQEFKSLYIELGGKNFNSLDIIVIFLLFGIAAKSAQLPFRTWLVNAMSAPSPVSALIRAATLVTSGIFLILKFSFLIEFSHNIFYISLLGIVTALFSAFTAVVQNDSKRIVAYSTCSQLGYMTFICGLSQYRVGFFHLVNHGSFKALLFLASGALIHSLDSKQDIRVLGGLFYTLPLNYSLVLIGSLTLVGFPFLSGFFSKDLIIELSFVNYSFYGFSIYLFSTFIAGITSIYSARLIFLVYVKTTNLNRLVFKNHRDSGLAITISIIVLTFLSIFNGFIFSDLFVGIGSDYFDSSLFQKAERFSILDSEFQRAIIKNFPLICTCVSIAFTFFTLDTLRRSILKESENLYRFFIFLNCRWFFDFLQNKLSIRLLLLSHNVTFKLLDKGLLESLGPTGLLEAFKNKIFVMTYIQSGYLYHYLVSITLTWFSVLGLALLDIKLKNLLILILYIMIF